MHFIGSRFRLEFRGVCLQPSKTRRHMGGQDHLHDLILHEGDR